MRTCFVAADPQTDLTGLRQILEDEGFQLVLWSDATLSPGKRGSSLAFELIREASVVLGVLAGRPANPNALYELGVASALGKPIVLWVDDEADVPSNLRSLPIIKFAPEAPETLRFALHHAGRREGLAEAGSIIDPPRQEIHRAQHSHDDLARWLAEVFRQEGATVVEGQKGIGSDFALWLPDLEPSVGNPFVVEVKHSLETERLFEAAVGQVDRYLSATGGSWGMLVYRLGPPGQEIDAARRWPTILVLRADELEGMLQDTSFAEVVHQLRNERAHGVR